MKRNSFENILGYPITTLGKVACIEKILEWIKSGEKGKYLVCANPHSLMVANGDVFFREAMVSADLIVPDGAGNLLASRILKGTIRHRVTGSDIFQGVSSALNHEKGYSYLFLGSTEENLKRIREKMGIDFPHITIAGTYSPPFKSEFSDEDNETMLSAVNAVKPHVLWVGMTAPKQEKWIYKNKNRLDVRFVGAVGAVFDFYAGNVKRPGPWFQNHGLEWAVLLFREPRRLWYRNFVSTPRFLTRVLAQRLSHNRDHGI